MKEFENGKLGLKKDWESKSGDHMTEAKEIKNDKHLPFFEALT
jgi:hypothetical protein